MPCLFRLCQKCQLGYNHAEYRDYNVKKLRRESVSSQTNLTSS